MAAAASSRSNAQTVPPPARNAKQRREASIAERAAAKAAAEREMREAAAHAAAMRALHKLQLALRADEEETLRTALRQAEPLVGALPALAAEIDTANARLHHLHAISASVSAPDDYVMNEVDHQPADSPSPPLRLQTPALPEQQGRSVSTMAAALPGRLYEQATPHLPSGLLEEDISDLPGLPPPPARVASLPAQHTMSAGSSSLVQPSTLDAGYWAAPLSGVADSAPPGDSALGTNSSTSMFAPLGGLGMGGAESVTALVQQLRDVTDAAIPPEFLCPITQEVMIDPVVTHDGNTYERTAITAWLAKHDTAPLTGEPLASKAMFPCLFARAAIRSYFEAPAVPPKSQFPTPIGRPFPSRTSANHPSHALPSVAALSQPLMQEQQLPRPPLPVRGPVASSFELTGAANAPRRGSSGSRHNGLGQVSSDAHNSGCAGPGGEGVSEWRNVVSSR